MSDSMVAASEDPYVGTKCKACSGEMVRVFILSNNIIRNTPFASAIRKDQINFSSMSMDESVAKMTGSR